MLVLSEREIGAADMVSLTALVLGESGRVGGAALLYAVLADANTTEAEVLTLRLPDLHPLDSTRVVVPAAVSSAFLDMSTGWLYLLCSSRHPRILRQRVFDGRSMPVPGTSEGLTLPWAAASTLLLPFPAQRQLLVFAASGNSVEGRPLLVCRIYLGIPLSEVRVPCASTADMHLMFAVALSPF